MNITLPILLIVAFWLWGFVITIKYWDKIPTWAKVLAIIGLIFPSLGPIITIIVVYIGRAVNTQ